MSILGNESIERDTQPSVSKTAFACPFCGAYTTQYWYSAHVCKKTDNGIPFIPSGEPATFSEQPKDVQETWRKWVQQYEPGKVFLSEKTASKYVYDAENINFSKCYSCSEIAVWVHEKLVFPSILTGPQPNLDLPADIKAHYEEARAILNLSPRGAAALLRLCIEKLCIHLNTGKNLNDAIRQLKQRGLKQKVIDALDIVRVIGNEAVHPGTIDLNDNKQTAEALFGLVNIIAEEMISEDKHIDALYNMLPEDKRKQIEQRDKRNG